VAPIFVDSTGQNRILVVKGANDRLSPADVDGASDLLRGADSIVLQLEIPIATVYHTLRFARAHGIRTILNPAPGQALDLAEVANADYVIPNETEAEALSGMTVRSVEDARACALRNNIAESRNENERFFSLWRDADADLGVIKQARSEYARFH